MMFFENHIFSQGFGLTFTFSLLLGVDAKYIGMSNNPLAVEGEGKFTRDLLQKQKASW